MNVKENFSGRAADYTTGRPGYAKVTIGNHSVAYIGSL